MKRDARFWLWEPHSIQKEGRDHLFNSCGEYYMKELFRVRRDVSIRIDICVCLSCLVRHNPQQVMAQTNNWPTPIFKNSSSKRDQEKQLHFVYRMDSYTTIRSNLPPSWHRLGIRYLCGLGAASVSSSILYNVPFRGESILSD
jgi:hypothetical protein